MRALPAVALIALVAACNGAPLAPVVGIDPETPRTADLLTAVLIEEALDVEGDPLTYAWTWSVDGVVQDDLVGDTVPAEITARGQVWEVAVTANDGEHTGEAGIATVTIANTPPTGTVLIGPATPSTTDRLIVIYGAEDADGDAIEQRFAWTVDGEDADWTEGVVPPDRTAAGQVWSVTFTPFDDADDGEPVSAEVQIGNTAPVITAAWVDPAEPGEDSVLTAGYEGTDVDGDEIEATVTWYVDDGEVSGQLDGSLTGSAFDKGQRVSVAVQLSDGDAVSDVMLSDAVVVRNTPPTVRVVRIDPLTLFEDSVATVVGGSWADVDGDAEAYRVVWTVDGVEVAEADSIDGTLFDKGQVVSCTAWPFDGEDEGEPVDCNRVGVQNSAPSLTGVSLSPDPARTDDDLTPTPEGASDADGDDVTVSYSWTVNGTAAGSGSTLAASATAKGDTVAVTATPSDGTKPGTAVTGAITIANTAPTITSATLSPSTLRTRDEASVSWVTDDVDGDSVTASVTWTVDGTTAGTGSTLSFSKFSRGDDVEASIVATDGTDSSAATTVSTTVVNTAPTAPTMAVSPTYPAEDDDLACTLSTAASDDDGDSLTYTVSWTRNGAAFTTTRTTTHANDTIDGADTSPGDLFGCTAVANDGFADGPASAAAEARVAGGFVTGFSGETGPTFSGWTQCEGYWDTTATGEIPADWGDDCEGTAFTKLRLVCGASTGSYRYIDVSKNVFRDKLSSYPESGLILQARDSGGASFSITNSIWATSNDPYKGASWWAGPDGCGSGNTNLTVNNRCTYEASNCFGQGISGSRYLWIYAGY